MCTYKYTHSYVQVCIHINPPPTPCPFFALKQLFCTFVLKSQSCSDLKENLKIIHTYRNNQVQPCFMLQKKSPAYEGWVKVLIGSSQDHTFPISPQGHMTAFGRWASLSDTTNSGKASKKVPFVQVLLNTDKHLHD